MIDPRWVGYFGLAAFALAWLPQCWATVRAGRCGADRAFLLLYVAGSSSLGFYALLRREPVFSSLNALTTFGAAMNLYYSFFPKA